LIRSPSSRSSEAATETSNILIFFSLELIALDDEYVASLVVAPAMADYLHYVEALRRFKPHILSEKEEQAINQKNLTGRHAFEQLYEELTGSLRFKLQVDGEEKELTDGEIMALLRRPDRGLRERAFATFLDTHAQHALVITSVFNNIFLDHKVDCEMRQYDDVVLPTHLSNEIEPQTVEAMMQAVERHYPLAQEYFRIKARMLGLEKLKNTDVYAPIDTEEEQLTFAQAQEMILTAFGRFSEPFAAIAYDFFSKRWIDAEVRAGKRGGAFCAALTPQHHPYVLCSFNGTGRDVSTIAHELGHGIHYSLSRKQRLVNYDAPLVLAETASVFAEIVLTKHLLAETQSKEAKRAILCELLEEMYGTVFRQTALTRFEMAGEHCPAPIPLCVVSDVGWTPTNRSPLLVAPVRMRCSERCSVKTSQKPRSRGIFKITGLSPELSRYPQESCRHPRDAHRSCTGKHTVDPASSTPTLIPDADVC